jgi:hypothetical protein
MGAFLARDGIRGYVTYEDTNMDGFKATQLLDGGATRKWFRLRDYIAFRQKHQKPGQRIGFKAGARLWIDEPDPEELEMDVVLVHRPLEHAILSDQRIWTLIPKQRPDKEPLTPRGFLNRAAHIAKDWSAKNLLRYAVGLKAEIEYYDLLEDPQMQLMVLCDALDLQPTEEQMRSAILFIDPEMRNV